MTIGGETQAVMRLSPLRAALALSIGVIGGLCVLAVATNTGSPFLGPLLLLAVVAIPAVITRPPLMLLVLVVAEASNLSGVAAGLGSPGVQHVLLLLGGVALAHGMRRGTIHWAWSPVLLLGMLFLAAQVVATIAARAPASSLAAVGDTIISLVFLGVVFLLATSSQTTALTGKGFSATLAALALLTVAQEFALSNSTEFAGFATVPLAGDIGTVTARHAGPHSDVNFWGRVLVLAVPLAAAAAATAHSRLSRVCWLSMVASLCGGVYLTGSRGALLALVAGLLIWAALAGSTHRRWLRAAPPLLLVALLLPGVGSRLATLIDTTAGPGVGRLEPSRVGRSTAQIAGLRMVADAPFTGIGPGRFEEVAPEYARRFGLATDEPFHAHNLYLHLAAEGGVSLLFAYLAMIVGTVVVALRARRRLLGRDDALAATVAGAVGALAAWSVASLFLHLGTFRSLAVVLALVAALDVMAKRQPALAADQAARPIPLWARRGVPAATLAVAAFVVLTWSVPIVPGLSKHAWRSDWEIALSSRNAGDDPYVNEVGTREPVILTFVAVARNSAVAEEAADRVGLTAAARRDVRVEVGNSAGSALLRITVTGPDRTIVERMSAALRDTAVESAAALDSLYGLAPVSATAQSRARRVIVVDHARTAAVGLSLFVLTAGAAARPRRALSRATGRASSAAFAPKDRQDGSEQDFDVRPY